MSVLGHLASHVVTDLGVKASDKHEAIDMISVGV